MALSRYSVLPNQQVINTYVSPDLRYIAAAGQAQQQGYDEGLQFEQASQDKFAKFATRDVDVSRKNQLVDQYTTEAQKIIADHDGDVGRALPALRSHASTYAANPFWDHATNALSQQKDYYETQKRIAEKGGTALNFNDDAVHKAVYNEDGTYNTVGYETQQALDYTEPKQKLMADIAKDTRLSGLSGTEVEGLLKSGKFTGVTGQKVLAVARQNLMPYLGTDAGRQELRVLEKQGYTPQQIERRLLTSLAGIGAKQVGQTADVDYRELPGFNLYLRDKLKKQQDAQDVMELQGGQTGATQNPIAPQPISIDDSGRPYVEQQIQVDKIVGKAGTETVKVPDVRRNYDMAKDQLQSYRQSFKALHPKEATPSDKQLAELYNTAAKNSGLVTLRTSQMTPKAANMASLTMLGVNYKKGDVSNLQGKPLMLLGTNGEATSRLTTLPELLKTIGVDDKKEDKITSAQVTGRIHDNPLIPGAYRVTITAGGKSYEVAVGGPQQEQDFKGAIQPLVQAAYAGKIGRAQVGKVTFKSISAPNPDGSGFSTQVRGYEKVGDKLVPLRERNPNGSVKKDKHGKVVYAPYRSLQQFTDDYHNVFLQAHGDQFGVSGFTNKEAEDDPDTD